MMFERLNTLAHGLFRVRLAGVGIGSCFEPFPIALGVFRCLILWVLLLVSI
jgi:hypothetical protein